MIAHLQFGLIMLITMLPFEAKSTEAARLLESTRSVLRAEDGAEFSITRGRIQVSALHAERGPDSPKFELAFVRIHRADGPAASAHIVLAGGPGESGVELVQGLARQGGVLLDPLFDADIIGLDQRGTGASSPNLADTRQISLPLDQPASSELWLPILRRTVADATKDLAQRGIDVRAFNTRESADDIEDLRRALGYQQLTVWGRSYGSHLALAYARAYPDSVQRMVLVAPEGPDHTWKLPSAANAVLESLELRPGASRLRRDMAKVLARLRENPVRVRSIDPLRNEPTEISIGVLDLQWITANALANPQAIATLPAAYRKMAQGDFSAFAPIALRYRQRISLQSAMKHLMNASSGASLARRLRIRQEAQTSLLGNALNFPWMALESDWGAQELGAEFRAPLVSAIPTLILVGELDVNTPVANATEIASSLSQATQIVVPGAAHQFDLFGSKAMRGLLQDFLQGKPITQSSIRP